MRKQEIESILLANRYLTLCKSDEDKYLIARKYLTHKIKKALNRSEPNKMPLLKFNLLGIIFVVR
jgi:hypothetical protein